MIPFSQLNITVSLSAYLRSSAKGEANKAANHRCYKLSERLEAAHSKGSLHILTKYLAPLRMGTDSPKRNELVSIIGSLSHLALIFSLQL